MLICVSVCSSSLYWTEEKRFLLDMRGVANTGGCCFRRGGKARKALSGVAVGCSWLLELLMAS
jgi:hypothetical protein